MTDKLKPKQLPTSQVPLRISGMMPMIHQLHLAPEFQKPSPLEILSGYRNEKREQLKSMTSLGKVLREAEDFTLEHFPEYGNPGILENPKLSSVLTLGGYQKTPQTTQEYGQLLEAKSQRQKMAREIVRDIITDPESKLEISDEQRILLTYGLQIQNVVDDLHIAWHKELIQGEHADALRNLMENDEFLDLLVGQHGDFIYGLLRKEGESITYVPYARAYPQKIETISSLINGMVEDMMPLVERGSVEAKSHIAVHRQWQKLLISTDAKEQEALGKELDVVWMRDADANDPAIRSQILYPMEAYSAGKAVEWQYDILLRQPEYDEINKMCDDTKWEMHRLFQSDPDFVGLPTLQESLSILGPTNSTVYLRFIGGTPLGFRSAASNVPNRNDVRLGHNREDKSLANGSKINFDYVTFEQRSQIAKELVENIFGDDRAEEIFGDTKELIPLLLGRFVAGHEDAHNILERPDTYRIMGMQNHIDLDEAKADLASIITCFQPNWLPQEAQATLVKAIFAEEMRGLSRWAESKTDRSHLNGNIMLIQLMLDSDIVSFHNGIWHFDNTNPHKLRQLEHRAKDAFLDLAAVYEATEPEVAREQASIFKEKYIETPSRELLQLVFDAGIFSEADYEETLSLYYPTITRRTAVATGMLS